MSKSSIHADHFTNPNQQTQIVIHKICFLWLPIDMHEGKPDYPSDMIIGAW